jgi:hypothetical protein
LIEPELLNRTRSWHVEFQETGSGETTRANQNASIFGRYSR